jgi:outer membrane biosynthesis protein TonB
VRFRLLLILGLILSCTKPEQNFQNGGAFPPPSQIKDKTGIYSKVSPKLIPRLEYPYELDPTRAGGKVIVLVQVDKFGKPEKAISISGDNKFFKPAEAYVMSWEFYPAILNGEARPARFTATVNFLLRGIQ